VTHQEAAAKLKRLKRYGRRYENIKIAQLYTPREEQITMQVKQITVEISRTYNLGNFSNIKPTVSIIAALSEGDDPEQAADEARLLAETQIDAAICQATRGDDNTAEKSF